MITINPFSELAEIVPAITMRLFVVLIIILVVVGTLFDMIHKKNVKYFFENAKKAKKSAIKSVNVAEKTSIILKTVASDVLTTSELDGKRRVAHLLGMYGTVIFWVTSVIMIFCYSTSAFCHTFYFAITMAFRSNNDMSWWLLVLVLSQS